MGDAVLVTTNPLTSFSRSRDIALTFAEDSRIDGRVLWLEVPASKVFSLPISGSGCYLEKEVVLLGGRYKCYRVQGVEL